MTLQRVRITPFRTAMAASVFAFATVLAPVSMDAAYAADVEQLLDDARSYKAEGRVADSMIQIKNALQQEPANAAANALLGVLYLDMGDVQRGQLQLERARDLGGAADAWMVPLLRAWLAVGEQEQVLELTEDLPESLDAQLRSDALAMRGRALAAAGDVAAARQVFEQAAAIDPSAALAPAGLARLEAAAGNHAKAEELAKTAFANDPDDADVLYLMGDLAAARGDLDEAVARFQAIKDLKPVNPFVRVVLARALVSAERLDEAAETLDWVLERVPGYAEAQYLRAHINYRQGELAAADRLMTQALAIDPSNPDMQVLAGLVKYRLDQHEQAVRLLSGVAEGANASRQARMALGASLLRTGRSDRAYAVLAPIAPSLEGDADALVLMGEAARMAGKPEEALGYLEAARELRPDDPRILRTVAAVQSALGQVDAGLETLGGAVEKDPSDMEAVATYYAMLLQGNMVDQALAVADQVVASHPEQPRGHTMRGLALLASKDLKGAEAAFREALKTDPAAADAAGNLASLLRMTDRDDEAETVLRDAHEAAPERTDLMLRLADMAAARDDKAGARTWLEQAVATGATDARPRARLGALLLTEGRTDAALAAILPGLAAHPRDAELLTVAAEARLAAGESANAVSSARTLAEVRPDLPSYRILVRAARQAGDAAALEAGLEGVVALQPENLDALLGLAQLALSERDPLAAREHMDAALALDPDNPRVIQMETRTRLALDPRGGVDYLRAKLDTMEDPPRGLVELLATAERRTEPARALERLAAWVESHPDETRTMLLLSMWQIEDERYDEARAVLERLVQAVPDSWISQNNLAYVLLRSGELDKALEHATQARLHGGDQPELLDTEGQIRLAMNDAVMAEQLFRQAASQTSRPAHRLNLAEALLALDRTDDARRILEQLEQSRAEEADRERARELLAQLGN